VWWVRDTRAGAADGMHAYKIYYPAEQREPTPNVHDGHDWIYVLSGRLRLVLGDEDLTLEPGEAAEFSCRVPHSITAIDGPAEALAIFGPTASGSTRDNAETTVTGTGTERGRQRQMASSRCGQPTRVP
jgi:mannose-6-phosphate isomerase-like protein (cupin superfamily)